jgi:splicing suppressor protein 51
MRVLSPAASKLLRNAPRARLEPRPVPPRWRSLDWQELLVARGWLDSSELARADAATRNEALALLSSALTYPLTATAALASVVPDKGTVSVCVLGARAEASLPAHFWSEARDLLGCRELTVLFCGPKACVPVAVANSDPHLTLVHPSEGQLFHQSSLGRSLLGAPGVGEEPPPALPDAFLCFNPGLGHRGWERAWEPTVRAMRRAGRPILLTALGQHDAEADRGFLIRCDAGSEQGREAQPLPRYAPNSWASMVDTARGSGGIPSRANALVALLGGDQAT